MDFGVRYQTCLGRVAGTHMSLFAETVEVLRRGTDASPVASA